jgi:hypothetical protein
METWAGRRIRRIFLVLTALKFAILLYNLISPSWARVPLSPGEIAVVILWTIGSAALTLGVPAMVVLGPFRRVPWLIWLVLYEACIDVWGLLTWPQLYFRTPLSVVDFGLSIALVFYAFAWVRLPKD